MTVVIQIFRMIIFKNNFLKNDVSSRLSIFGYSYALGQRWYQIWKADGKKLFSACKFHCKLMRGSQMVFIFLIMDKLNIMKEQSVLFLVCNCKWNFSMITLKILESFYIFRRGNVEFWFRRNFYSRNVFKKCLGSCLSRSSLSVEYR